jgi:8-hydroxy-5-deazaflavin:NADPH oxidoreductase
MRIGIIGAGIVRSNMGKALRRTGHEIMFSSRDPESEKMQALCRETGGAAGSVAETAAFSDVLFMALSWDAIPTAVQTGDWAGKILIDATNRFGPGLSILPGESAGQELAHLTRSRVVKAFNTIGAEHYLAPVIGGEAASMLMAGDDAEAKQVVSTLASQLGFVPVDAGSLSAAVYLEGLAALWVHLAIRTPLGRDFAFRVIR